MKKLIHVALAVAALFTLNACGPKTSPYSQEARARAVKAAHNLIAVDHADTFALQKSILSAGAVRSEYLIIDDTIAAGDFDHAFQEEVTRKDPRLAAAIFKK